MKLRISEQVWNRFCEQLLFRDDVETAGLLFGEAVHTDKETIVVVRDVKVLPDDAYTVRKLDQLSIDPISMNRLTKDARTNRWSIFTIHTHPKASEPWFSEADDIGDERLIPSFQCQVPEVSHGSIVLVNDGSCVVRAYDEKYGFSDVTMQIVGKTISLSSKTTTVNESWFSRQVLALGESGQCILRDLRVGVVGLGGVGSIVSMQLSHLGVGEIVLIDGDVVESSNVSRIIGAHKNTSCQKFKVDIAADYAESIGLSHNIERHPEFLSSNHEMLIAGCDVVMSCVDTHSARALLNRFSYQYNVPVIDLGTVFRVDDTGVIVSDAGRVVTVGPGRPCLACWGHIDPNAIRYESMSKAGIEQEVGLGYIQGAQIAQPSVINFNTQVAGSGVTELVRLATAFAGSDSPPNRLAFSFKEGVVRRNSLLGDARCTVCGNSDELAG